MKTVTVDAEALRQVLTALNGASHLIRELQATRDPLMGKGNPINKLIEEFNAAVDVRHNRFVLVPVDLPHEVLAKAATEGLPDTGNPKHVWDYLLNAVRAVSSKGSDARMG